MLPMPSIFMFIGVALMLLGFGLRYFRCQYVWAAAAMVASCVLFASGVALSIPAACAAELPGPAAMAPVAVAPPWWMGLVSALLPDLVNTAVVGVLGLAGWALRRWAATSRLAADSYVRAYLERAGQRAIDLGYQAAGATPGQSLADAQLSAIMRTADAYLRDRVPDALRRFGLQKAGALSAFLNGLHAERVNWATDSGRVLSVPLDTTASDAIHAEVDRVMGPRDRA